MLGMFKQEFKTLFKSPASISILIIPVVLMIGLGYLLPSGWIVPSAITIGIVGSVLLYFGGSIEEIKRTSFMKSISLTKLNKFTYLANKILFSILIALFSVLWVLFFGWFFSGGIVDFLATDFSNLLPASEDNGTVINIIRLVPFTIDWSQINWFLMLYAGAITIIVSISIAFIFVTFSKSSLSFYLMSFGYLLAMILFGGVVMPSFLISSDNAWFKYFYYLVPNFYTNNIMAQSFGNGIGSLVGGITDKLGYVANDYLANASDDTVQMVNSWIGSWDWTQESLDIAFTKLSSNSSNYSSDDWLYIESVYETLTWLVSGGGLQQVGELVGELLDRFAPIISTLLEKGILHIMYNNYVGDLENAGDAISYSEYVLAVITQLGDKVTNVFGDILTPVIHTFLKNNPDLYPLPGPIPPEITIRPVVNTFLDLFNVPIGHYLAGRVDVLITYVLSNIMNIGPLNSFVSKTLTTILLTNQSLAAPLSKVVNTLDNMFNTAQPYDYYIPWIETFVFLGISVTFFKWS